MSNLKYFFAELQRVNLHNGVNLKNPVIIIENETSRIKIVWSV